MALNYKTVQELIEPMTFFCDADNPEQVYVKWPREDHMEICFLEDRKLQAFLSEQYRLREDLQYAPNLKPALRTSENQAILNEQTETLYQRTAGTTSYMEYFLANKNWERVIIKPEGWSISRTGIYNFLKPASTQEQVPPAESGNVSLLDSYINLPPKELQLFKIHLIQLFMPYNTHLAMVLSSSKGTGKSTLSRMIRELIDPCLAGICSTPKSYHDFENLLANENLCILDNTATFSEEISDLLAGAVTGTSVTRRKLYTNRERVVSKLKTALVVNGIEIISPRSDLCERSLCYQLQKIKQENRRTDQEFWSSFQRDKPVILGGIFDTIAAAMEIRKDLHLSKRHRMADAFEDMAAIAAAMDLTVEAFEDLFYNNVQRLQKQFAEANSVVEAVEACMVADGKKELQGPAGKLYERLRHTAYGRASNFPGSSSAFTRWLNGEGGDILKAAGFSYSHKRQHDYMEVTIRRIGGDQ